jgi:nucleoside-diphosphate-sugar epimerase
MRVALTGASGIAGHFLRRGLAGHAVTTLGRRAVPGLGHRDWSLTGPAADLAGFDAVIHAAFQHEPGRYRGGEGDDPAGFRAANLDGTRRLFDAAAAAGVGTVIFLSSRAVFDGCPPGTPLTEDGAPDPVSLYGAVKAGAEAHLGALPLRGISLRATGLYGPGPGNKWAALFDEYRAGRPITPRRGTELHGDDLAAACALLLDSDLRGPVHACDILVDRHDLLSAVQRLTGIPHSPPARSEGAVNALDCARLAALGWRPRGWAGLEAALPAMLA